MRFTDQLCSLANPFSAASLVLFVPNAPTRTSAALFGVMNVLLFQHVFPFSGTKIRSSKLNLDLMTSRLLQSQWHAL
jgi:hypothetical protein